MNSGSLRLRLLLGTLLWLLLALGVAGWGMRKLFDQHITQQFEAQLVLQLDQLSGAMDWEPDGTLAVTPEAGDSRFGQPLSGLYWQVNAMGDAADRVLARSRSL